MSEIITEALLEMHFHSALVQHFQSIYGARFLKLLKPSPQQEAWVGFDQAWAKTTLSTRELFNELRDAIRNNKTRISKLYFGFFLQFKAVEKIVRKSRLKPDHFDTPYFRSLLSLHANKTSGLSQHETLLRLNQVFGTTVQYACAMLFDPEDIWQPPDLSKLRLIDISTAPSGWATNQQHFVAFQTEADPSPYWCSEPIEGRSISFTEWASPQNDLIRPMTPENIRELIEKSYLISSGKGIESQGPTLFHSEPDYTLIIPQSFTILEYEKIQQ